MAAMTKVSVPFYAQHTTDQPACFLTLNGGIDPKGMSAPNGVRFMILLTRGNGCIVKAAARVYDNPQAKGTFTAYGQTYTDGGAGPVVQTIDISGLIGNKRYLDLGLQITGNGDTEGTVEISFT